MNATPIQKAMMAFLLVFASLVAYDNQTQNDPIVGRISAPNVISMPLLQNDNPRYKVDYGSPQEDRGPEYRRFLSASLRISVSGGSGSGTIIAYDSSKNEAYVASCGHLWEGTRSSEQLRANPQTCTVTTWYHNNIKLPTPKNYKAKILFWSNNRGYDSSLLVFNPDWNPNFFPIAPLDYPLPKGTHFHSLGCDGAGEVARYDVEIVGMQQNDLIITRNTPRPGRSGGGLLSNDGFYVATCWGTSDTSGRSGIGYFTPLKSIHKMFTQNGFGWLLSVNGIARQIPIIDINNPQGNYPQEYIQFPSGNSQPIRF